MKAIYIEAFAGISGNMLLGALIDAGVPFDHLASEMKKLHLGEYELINERVNKCGIDANYLMSCCQMNINMMSQLDIGMNIPTLVAIITNMAIQGITMNIIPIALSIAIR